MPQGKFSGGCQAKDAPAYNDHIKGNCLLHCLGSVVREGGHGLLAEVAEVQTHCNQPKHVHATGHITTHKPP